MSLPASGEISYNQINIEVGNSSGSEASMNQMIFDSICATSAILDLPDNISDWYSFTQGVVQNDPTGVALSYNAKTGLFTTSWTDNATSETGYEVQIFHSPTWGYEACCTTGANGTSCTCSPTHGSGTYTTRVRALGCSSEAHSNWVYSNNVSI